uniref:Mediator of RNA polymerase II transcription subunit 9 n=1 Tax=Spongospora subterranea TaxID=70186 RepID=A0A0H5QHM8_9EUKA|eukprot:CRZ01162.1 hypothetical protein [Spongospora subterranea]
MARTLTAAEIAASFDLLTPIANILSKCKEQESDKAVSQAAEDFAKQLESCRDIVKRLDPLHKSHDELETELHRLHRMLAAKIQIARRFDLIPEEDSDVAMSDFL